MIAKSDDEPMPPSLFGVLAFSHTVEQVLHNSENVKALRALTGGLNNVMQKFPSVLLAGMLSLGLTCGLAQAQNSSAKRGSSNREKITGQNMTVTGCLQKEEKEKNEYLITGEDGRTWGLKSSSVKLGGHLNHKVTVTGKVTKEGHEKEAGDLNVTNLKMVSETCP